MVGGRHPVDGPGSGYTRSFGSRRASLELQHFEDLPLGSEWTTRRRTIGPAEVAVFLGLSGDLNPLYADVEYAHGGPFGEVVVPGALIAATAIGLGTIDGPVPATVGLVGMDWRFQRPVRVGDTIQCRWRLHRKRDVENPRWGLAVWQVEVENQRGEVVATADLVRLVSRRQVPTEVRPGKRRRRRRGLETGTVEPPPKPPPGPLREPLPEPERWPEAARGERPRPPEPLRPERGPEKAPEAVPARAAGRGRRPPRPAQPVPSDRPEPAAEVPAGPETVPAPAAPEPGRPSPAPESGDSRHGLETAPGGPPSVTPEAGAWRPPEEVRRREEARTPASAGQPAGATAETEARPAFAPLAPEASWPVVAPPAPAEAPAEVQPAPRRQRRASTAPAAGGDTTEAPTPRRRRRRHGGGSTPAAPAGSPPPEGSIPETEPATTAAIGEEGTRDDPAAPAGPPPEG